MPDLETKFETLEAQLATQHTAIGNALDSILTAMGAPPPTATVTLGDTLAMMVALNNNLIGMAIADGSFHTALLEKLDILAVNTDLIITNNSLNAQRVLMAILSTACACPTDTPFIGPPLDVTPTTLADEAKCRRIQYYLSIFGALIDGIANYAGAGAMVTSATITELLYAAAVGGGLVGGEVGAVGGPPGIVVGAIVGIIGALIGSLGSSYLFTMSAQWHQSPLPDQLLSALYDADSADTGATAFYAVINASDVLNAPFKPLINALFWNGWANDIYALVPVVDDSAFDGTICAPLLGEITTCHMFTSASFAGPNGNYQEVRTDPVYGPNAAFVAGNFEGWSIRIVTYPGSPVRVDHYTVAGTYNSGVELTEVDEVYFWPATAAIGIRTGGGHDTPYTIELCPPA
jgi:hypothetical protein